MRSPVRRRVSRGRSPLPPIRAGQRRPSDLRIDENTRALFLQVCCVIQLLPVPGVLCLNPTIQSATLVWPLAPHEPVVLLASTAIPACAMPSCSLASLRTASYTYVLLDQLAVFMGQGFAMRLGACPVQQHCIQLYLVLSSAFILELPEICTGGIGKVQ